MPGISSLAIITVLTLTFSGLFTGAACSMHDLDEENWKSMLEGEWMIQFVAPWCPSCKIVAPIWERFAKMANKYKVEVGRVDITKSPSLSGRFLVTSLPTIYHVNDGEFRLYQGQRDIDALIDFIKMKEWLELDPAPFWSNPNSYHMAALSYFFRLSFMLKEWNATLREDYGFSVYGAYALFVFGTILVGATLGLFLVAVIDLICPSRKSKRRRFEELSKQRFEDAHLIKDDIEDLSQEDEEEQIIEISSCDENEGAAAAAAAAAAGIGEKEVEDSDADGTFVVAKDIDSHDEEEIFEDLEDKERFHSCKLTPIATEIRSRMRSRKTF